MRHRQAVQASCSLKGCSRAFSGGGALLLRGALSNENSGRSDRGRRGDDRARGLSASSGAITTWPCLFGYNGPCVTQGDGLVRHSYRSKGIGSGYYTKQAMRQQLHQATSPSPQCSLRAELPAGSPSSRGTAPEPCRDRQVQAAERTQHPQSLCPWPLTGCRS